MSKLQWLMCGPLGLLVLATGCQTNPLTRLDNLEQRMAAIETKAAVMQQWFIVFVVVSAIAWVYLFLKGKNP